MGFWKNLLTINDGSSGINKLNDYIFEKYVEPKIEEGIHEIEERGRRKLEDVVEKIDMILASDVETEGKKKGYARAAEEYEIAFERLQEEYLNVKKIANKTILEKEEKCNKLIEKIQELEKEKKFLIEKRDSKMKDISEKYDVSLSKVSDLLSQGIISSNQISLIELIYNYKKKKMLKAEREGYIEARNIYIEKIKELKNNLERLRIKNDKELKELISIIRDALREISNLEVEIAEMKILLG